MTCRVEVIQYNIQESKGFIYIPNDKNKIIPSVDYNLWLKRLDTQLYEPLNQNSTKVPKVIITTNKKTLL